MSEVKILHTPWSADVDADIFDTNGGYSIDIVNTMGETVGKAIGKVRETVEKNAKAQAAAPELLEALQGLVNDVKNKPNDTRYATHLKIALSAIKKATT